MDEFVPQRTSGYISQNDLHIVEMTVKETLDFFAQCQGVGLRYGKSTIEEHGYLPLSAVCPFLFTSVEKGFCPGILAFYPTPIKLSQEGVTYIGAADAKIEHSSNEGTEKKAHDFMDRITNSARVGGGQVAEKVHNIAASGRTGGLSGPGHISSQGRVGYTNLDDSEGATGTVCGEDCDQPSPVSILEVSFSNVSCNSAESLGGTHVHLHALLLTDKCLCLVCARAEEIIAGGCMLLGLLAHNSGDIKEQGGLGASRAYVLSAAISLLSISGELVNSD